MNVSESTLISGFRYALGRMSYVVSEVAADIINAKDELSDSGKELIVKEINEKYAVNALGMEMDKKEWLKVLDALKG